jgi:hypothetical protein
MTYGMASSAGVLIAYVHASNDAEACERACDWLDLHPDEAHVERWKDDGAESPAMVVRRGGPAK